MNYNNLLKSTISPTPQPPMNPTENFHGGGGGGGGLADHFYTDGSKRNCRQQP